MSKDMNVPCDVGRINLRVGAIIMKDGQFLMVGNKKCPDYLYSVGGRIKFGETAEEAVVREVYEETGINMEIDRLALFTRIISMEMCLPIVENSYMRCRFFST